MENIRDFLLNEMVEPGLEPFVSDFFKDRKEDFLNLKKLIAENDLVSARKITHNWKGYCKPYGFETLGVLAAELEEACSSGNNDKIEELVSTVDAYLNKKGSFLAKD